MLGKEDLIKSLSFSLSGCHECVGPPLCFVAAHDNMFSTVGHAGGHLAVLDDDEEELAILDQARQ
jgi:hypothetical protein